jgi:subtilase family serine protease
MLAAVPGKRGLAGLLILALAWAAIALATSPPFAHTSTARLRPMIDTHVDQMTLSLAPTTAECLTQLHRACYQPAQYQQAYDLNRLYQLGYTGRGRTIVIMDPFGSPTIQQDLATFDRAFGLPDPPSLEVIAPAGKPPAFDPGSADMVRWAQETTLDVEYAHAIAPGARILLVVTPVAETEGTQGFPEIVAAESYVVNHHLGDVISQSFDATEDTFPGRQSLLSLRSAFKDAYRNHVTVLAAAGDNGATSQQLSGVCCFDHQVAEWPESDPLVTSVGGTRLHLDQAGNRTAPDTAMSDPSTVVHEDPNDQTTYAAGGGGPSHIFTRPAFQSGVRKVVGGGRGTPDISMSGACDGAAVYYYSFVSSGFHLVCGTSESTPLFAGIVAIADQIAGRRLGWINGSLYRLGARYSARASGISDVTAGSIGFSFLDARHQLVTVPGYAAAPGYDMATGWGTIDAARFCFALATVGGGTGGDPDAV